MNATYKISEKTGYTDARIPSFKEANTFHASRMRLDNGATVAQAIAIVKEDNVRFHYELMPKRTIAELARAYDARLATQSHKRYIDIDLPMIDDGGNW